VEPVTVYANLGSITAGDDYDITLTIVDEAKQPIHIGGLESAVFKLARKKNVLLRYTLGNGITLVDAENGELHIHLAAEDTEGLTGDAQFEVEIIDVEGSYRTPVYGVVNFRRALIANVTEE
jgi:hypothetical protein